MARASASDERPVVSFDHHAPEHVSDPFATYARLRRECPVGWTEAYGGFWVVSGYADVAAASLDAATFSSERPDLLLPARSSGRLLPVQSDPPAAAAYRRLLQPFFSVGATRALEPAIGRFTDTVIDRFIERGRCDLVLDLANPVPAMTTLELVGLPPEEWAAFAVPIHTYTYRRVDDPEAVAAAREVGAIRSRIEVELADRRAHPRGAQDLFSHLAAARIDGRPLSDDEITSLVLMVIFGGIDTTTAAIGSALLHLHRDRRARTLLIAQPERIPLAVEEVLRWAPPVQGFARTVTRDHELGGRALCAGETAMLLWASANRDPSVFADPDAVMLDRAPNPHLTFGWGPHRCLGATIARAELRIVLEAVLRRMPAYAIDESAIEPPQTVGVVFGMERIPATFPPGSRSA